MEAASQVPAPGERVVSCVIQVKQGYLAIQCENTYAGPLSLDDKGRPQTTKEDPSRHGFGLAQRYPLRGSYSAYDRLLR